MSKFLTISKTILPYRKELIVEGDKSLSIRWALIAALANGKSRAKNLLRSEDVYSTLNCLKKIGVKVKFNKNQCEIKSKGFNNFCYKKNLILNAGNSGTLGRLIPAILIKSPVKIKLIGDKSLSKRDFSRVIEPLKKFGVSFFPKNRKNLPLFLKSNKPLKPINYLENKGSAQCKSSIMFAALNVSGKTKIKAKKSRDHTEIIFKYLGVPIKVKKTKSYDFIEIKGPTTIKTLDYSIPSDISSAAFFLVLTTLSKKSKLLIKHVNINPTRSGVILILKKMGAKILFKNKKNYKGEMVADIFVESCSSLKAINCPISLNTSAIDEFLIIFLVAAKSKGISYFKDLSELDKKESPRLKLGSKILNMMGVKTKLTNHSIKIYGNPNLILKKKYEVKNFLKDHRIFMMSVIAGLSFGGTWKIHDPDSIKTSFPSFIEKVKKLGGKIN